MKVLVDTNVILDFFLSSGPYAAEARRIFEMISRDEIEAYTTASSITDIYYITEKRLGGSSARDAVRHLLIVLGIIAVDGNDCADALDLPMDDFEDALIAVCAGKEDMDYIVTNDQAFLQAGAGNITTVSPYDFVNLGTVTGSE
jgi:predicted nucleic acid-binding protein